MRSGCSLLPPPTALLPSNGADGKCCNAKGRIKLQRVIQLGVAHVEAKPQDASAIKVPIGLWRHTAE